MAVSKTAARGSIPWSPVRSEDLGALPTELLKGRCVLCGCSVSEPSRPLGRPFPRIWRNTPPKSRSAASVHASLADPNQAGKPARPWAEQLAEAVLDAQRRGLDGLTLGGRLRGGRRLAAEPLGDLAGLVHLGDDVAAADQLAVDEELGDRRPVRQPAQLLADARVGQDVDRGERRAE